MEMVYRERWQAEIAELQRILSGFDLREERKWGKPCYTMDGKKRRHHSGLQRILRAGLLSGSAAEGPEEASGAARAGSGGAGDEVHQRQGDSTKAATIKAYVREAVAAEKAGMKVETSPREFPMLEELKEKFRKDPRFKRAFEALTPGRQRGYLYHFAGAKQSGTRTARIEKAMPAIFEGRGFLEWQ
jgi:uncharacterized protein YdeI (YjbR/CyaY-like superfamily)